MEMKKLFKKKENMGSNGRNEYLSAGLTVLKASGLAVLLTVVLFLLTALVLLLAEIDDEAVPVIVQVIRILSIAFAGILCGRSVNKMGWLCGILSGITYVLITMLVGLLFYDSFAFDSVFIMDTAVGAVAGFIAGVIGINSKKKSVFGH